jgi:hypothetical protein
MPSPPNLPSPSTSLPDFSALKLFQRKQRGEAQSKSEARELRASEAQRATRHKTRNGTKERLFCSRNSPLFGTEELDSQNEQGQPILLPELVRCIIAVHIIIPYVSMLLWTKDSIFSQSKSLVKTGRRFLLDTRGNTVPPWQPAFTHVCPIIN